MEMVAEHKWMAETKLESLISINENELMVFSFSTRLIFRGFTLLDR